MIVVYTLPYACLYTVVQISVIYDSIPTVQLHVLRVVQGQWLVMYMTITEEKLTTLRHTTSMMGTNCPQEEWKCVLEELGELCVMISGGVNMQQLLQYVDNWGTLPMVGSYNMQLGFLCISTHYYTCMSNRTSPFIVRVGILLASYLAPILV